MKIYNVERKEAYDPDTEPSEIDDDDLQYLDKKDYEYIICSYAQDMWSGEGAAVLKDRNGKFMFIELGHCSCYGPLEERNPKCIYSLEEIIKLLDKHCKDTYGGYAKVVVEKLDVLIEAILDTHKLREERLESFYENTRVKEWRDARDRRVLLGALINRNYEGDRIAGLIGWLESRRAISWNDRDAKVVPYKLNDNLILIFS